MKKVKGLLKLSLAGLVLLPVAGSIAWAATVSNSSTGPLAVPNDPEQSTTMPQRIAQRKSALRISLNSLQSQNIAKKCSVAQTGLQQIKTKDQTAAANRQQVYQSLATQLATATDNLQRQSINNTALATAQAKFDNAINQYLADYETYKTAMDDGVVMDCAADPTGFEATLQSARKLRANLLSDAAQVKATLPALQQALAADKDMLIKNANSSSGASQ